MRSRKISKFLKDLGIESGDVLSTIAWNTHRHLEIFYGVPSIGAILHTANPRFSEEQIIYTINHAGSVALFFEKTFASLVERIRDRIPNVKYFISLYGDSPTEDCIFNYEKIIENCVGEEEPYPEFDERSGAFLCYTSGTTGNPKGVLYTHRSVMIHALVSGLSGALACSAFNSIMPCQSFYHATAWGVAFSALINGCKLVLPCDRMDPESLHELIQAEHVTFSAGVPTIWTGYLNFLQENNQRPNSLNRLLIGGSAVPRSLSEGFEKNYGVKVRQIWGMTETGPLGVVSTSTPEIERLGSQAAQDILWSHQGRMQFGAEIKIVDESGRELKRDGVSSGNLLIRGPWVIDRYYKSDASSIDKDGWFDTGDIACINEYGFLKITDRKKDIIKSGGEWISSIDLENLLMSYEGVKLSAVVGVYHPKWEERPIIIIEVYPGYNIKSADIEKFIGDSFPKWWIPDDVIFDNIPLTSVGKIDKRKIREKYRYHLSEK